MASPLGIGHCVEAQLRRGKPASYYADPSTLWTNKCPALCTQHSLCLADSPNLIVIGGYMDDNQTVTSLYFSMQDY